MLFFLLPRRSCTYFFLVLTASNAEHFHPATMYEIETNLHNPNTIKGFEKNGDPHLLASLQ
jgi:hypothetical protein